MKKGGWDMMLFIFALIIALVGFTRGNEQEIYGGLLLAAYFLGRVTVDAD